VTDDLTEKQVDGLRDRLRNVERALAALHRELLSQRGELGELRTLLDVRTRGRSGRDETPARAAMPCRCLAVRPLGR
jgi:hypothetical protein